MTIKTAKARLAAFWAALKPWVLVRLHQPSTYAGLIVKVAALVGLTITDSAVGQIAEVLAVIAGAAMVAYDSSAKSRPDDTDSAGA